MDISPWLYLLKLDAELQEFSEQLQARKPTILQPRRQVLSFDENSRTETQVTVAISGLPSAILPYVTVDITHLAILPPNYNNADATLQDGISGPVIVLNFQKVTYFTSGEYDVLLSLRLRDYIISGLSCPMGYLDYALSAVSNGSESMALDSVIVEVRYSGKCFAWNAWQHV